MRRFCKVQALFLNLLAKGAQLLKQNPLACKQVPQLVFEIVPLTKLAVPSPPSEAASKEILALLMG